MECVICRNGKTTNGLVTVVLERGASSVIIKEVPAEVCDNCGEYFLSEEVTERVMTIAEEAVRHGVEIEVLRYAA